MLEDIIIFAKEQKEVAKTLPQVEVKGSSIYVTSLDGTKKVSENVEGATSFEFKNGKFEFEEASYENVDHRDVTERKIWLKDDNGNIIGNREEEWTSDSNGKSFRTIVEEVVVDGVTYRETIKDKDYGYQYVRKFEIIDKENPDNNRRAEYVRNGKIETYEQFPKVKDGTVWESGTITNENKPDDASIESYMDNFLASFGKEVADARSEILSFELESEIEADGETVKEMKKIAKEKLLELKAEKE